MTHAERDAWTEGDNEGLLRGMRQPGPRHAPLQVAGLTGRLFQQVGVLQAAIPAMLASMTGRPSGEPERVTVRVTCGGAAAAGTTGSRDSPTRRDSQSDAWRRPDTVSARSHQPDSIRGTHSPVASPSAIKG